MKVKKSILAVAGVAALALPAAALAGHGHGSNHPVSYIFKGTYQGDGVVTVNHGNAHARHADLVDGDVTFDLSSAHLNVADTNADTVIDSTDVVKDDHVVVQARLPRHDPPVDPSVTARKLVDQTNPADDIGGDDTESDDTESGD